MIEILHYLKLRTLISYGNYGIFLTTGNAGFLSSTVECRRVSGLGVAGLGSEAVGFGGLGLNQTSDAA